MADIDLTWAHPGLAKCARKIFKHVRRDAVGRLNVNDMKSRFQRHARPMLGDIEHVDGHDWAYLDINWRTVLKDWAMCAGVSSYCPEGGLKHFPQFNSDPENSLAGGYTLRF
jgi:hypothetical protein